MFHQDVLALDRTEEIHTVSPSRQSVVEAVDDPSLWDREYNELLVIPSSNRQTPSKSLLLFDQLIGYKPGWRVLDSGSGPGRNSIYVAGKGCTVYSLDFSSVALHRLQTVVASSNTIKNSVWPIAASLQGRLPFRDESFDLTVDSYVFCHALSDFSKRHILGEYRRTIRPRGLVFSVVFSLEDEYYARLLSSGHGSGQIATDPANGISKYLYAEDELIAVLSANFVIRYFLKFRFYDTALESRWFRSTYVSLLEPRP